MVGRYDTRFVIFISDSATFNLIGVCTGQHHTGSNPVCATTPFLKPFLDNLHRLKHYLKLCKAAVLFMAENKWEMAR
jgi:hypothetical protein